MCIGYSVDGYNHIAIFTSREKAKKVVNRHSYLRLAITPIKINCIYKLYLKMVLY